MPLKPASPARLSIWARSASNWAAAAARPSADPPRAAMAMPFNWLAMAVIAEMPESAPPRALTP